jgi:hypothetical protein
VSINPNWLFLLSLYDPAATQDPDPPHETEVCTESPLLVSAFVGNGSFIAVQEPPANVSMTPWSTDFVS